MTSGLCSLYTIHCIHHTLCTLCNVYSVQCVHTLTLCSIYCTGLIHGIAWVAWSWWMYTRRRQTYVWKAAACVVYVTALVLLELFDFPPLLWSLDAHALWHLGTIPVPLVFYK